MKPESNFDQDKLDQQQAKSDADKNNAARSAQAILEELDRSQDRILELRLLDSASLTSAG